MDKKCDISTSTVIANIILGLIYITYVMMATSKITPGMTAGVFVSSLAGQLIALLVAPFTVSGVLGVLFGARSRPRIWFCLIMWLVIYFHYIGSFNH